MSIKTKVFTQIGTQIGMFFLSKIWPSVKELIERVVLELVDSIISHFKMFIVEYSIKKYESALNKSQDAIEKASKALSKQDAEKYEAISEIWKEVAEMYRQENEELKAKIDFFKKDLLDQTRKASNSLEANDLFDLSNEDEINLRKRKNYLLLP